MMERRALKFDAEVKIAAANGDNDLAQEMAVAQRDYHEFLCDDGPSRREWLQRKAEDAERAEEMVLRRNHPAADSLRYD